jgi:hypothetical protein
MNINLPLFILLSISALIGFLMFKRQNKKGSLGGPICKAKGFWLYYTIINWFIILPYAIYQLPLAPESYQMVWIALSLSMWIRGIIEMYMLFVSKNWTPIIGISHDIFTFIIMMIAFFYGNSSNITPEPILSFYTFSLFVSIIVETYYAYSFYQIMKGRTQGEDGLWYAHEEDPRFKKIILVTTIFNYFLYLALVLFLFKYLLFLNT